MELFLVYPQVSRPVYSPAHGINPTQLLGLKEFNPIGGPLIDCKFVILTQLETIFIGSDRTYYYPTQHRLSPWRLGAY